MKKRYTEEQIIGFLREVDKGIALKELCRKHGFSEASYYLWRSKYGGMDMSDAVKVIDHAEAEHQRDECQTRWVERRLVRVRGFQHIYSG